MDIRNGLTATHTKCRDAIYNIIDAHTIAKIWCIQHPDTKNILGVLAINLQSFVD